MRLLKMALLVTSLSLLGHDCEHGGGQCEYVCQDGAEGSEWVETEVACQDLCDGQCLQHRDVPCDDWVCGFWSVAIPPGNGFPEWERCF
jgi:hypothetical protein